MDQVTRNDEGSPGGVPRREWLVGGGEMGRLIRSLDWSLTPLGAIEEWPQSLRTTVSLCVASNFPISLVWGPHCVQIYNDGYWPICGGKHPASLGQDFRECWASAWPAIGQAFERALQGETSYLENVRMFLDRNGYLEETFFTFSFSPIHDETGGVGGLFHPVTETTAKMLAERRTRALRELTARSANAQTAQEALGLAAQALAEYDLDLPFVLLYRVDGTLAHLEAKAGTVPQKLAPTVVDLADGSDRGWHLGDVARTKVSAQIDDLQRAMGPFVSGPYPETPKAALVLPIVLPGGAAPTALLVAGLSSRLPLTDSYRAFADLLAATITSAVANASAYEEARGRAEALAELDRAKTTFFSNVSHEFRTPLTLMLGPLEDELAESAAPLPPARRQRLETAHRNSLRLLKLVNTLLDFSRIEAGRAHARFEPTDLAALTTELASVFRSAIEKAKLTLTVDCPPLPQDISVDRDMWEKIVLNLLSNGFKHTFSGGITLRLRPLGDNVVLSITDTGVGIPAAELPRVFERFHRVKGAASRSHEGTGIGLALVRELVRAHHGEIEVRSEEGIGSTFTVCIPVGNAQATGDRGSADNKPLKGIVPQSARAYVEEVAHWVEEPEWESEQEEDPLPEVGWPSDGQATNRGSAVQPRERDGTDRRSRVLWADDNADMRDYVKRLLSEHYQVTAVADGRLALESALRDPPDLVLTDVMMPGLDGFALLRALRAQQRTSHIPVILLSARAGEESALEGLEAGADDYLVKPFSARELVTRVRTHLELAAMRQRWVEELQLSNQELERASRAKSDFLAMMSHELRTPLNSIIGFSEVLIDGHFGALNERQARYVNNVNASGRHLLSLINDLLDLSKIEAGRMEVVYQACSPTKMVADAVATLQPLADAKRLRVTLVPAASDGAIESTTIRADAVRFKQIVYNVLSNAIKFSPPSGIVTLQVSTAPDQRFVRTAVTDQGPGIAPSDVARLFTPFTQLGNATPQVATAGTGLGLAVTRQLVEIMGGQVGVESVLGEGSTFFVDLPRHQPGVATTPAEVVPIDPSARLALIVDDEAASQELVELTLKEAGFRTMIASTGEEALLLARRHSPSVIVLDILLPGISGWDVLRVLHADEHTARIPVVIATVSDDRAQALGLGAVEHLVKPFGRKELLDALARRNFVTAA